MTNYKPINILGSTYKIVIRDYDQDEFFKKDNLGGYCDVVLKCIVICNIGTRPDWCSETQKTCQDQIKRMLRHEIVHAFLEESGLGVNSASTEHWARNEEMVDWLALQGPKIYGVWKDLRLL